MNKVKIRKGDTVKILSGKDKSKTGKVLQVFPKTRKLTVDNVNMHTRYKKSRKPNQPSQKIVFPAALPISKVILIDTATNKPTRVGFNVSDTGKKQRISKLSGKAV